MQRITITVDDAFLEQLDRLVVARGYQGRSEAIRDLARAGFLEATKPAEDAARDCVAALVYVYDHHSRELAKRLAQTFHDHHVLSLSSMHVHLDHENCFEVALLRGKVEEVRHFAEHVIAERGVRHGRLIVMPGHIDEESHAHGDGTPRRHLHTHVD